MSAPSVIERVKTTLVALKMPRALEVLDVTLRGIERGEIGTVEAIDALLTEELTTRETRRVRMAVRWPGCRRSRPSPVSDFAFQPSLDKNRILALAEIAVHRSRRSGSSDRAAWRPARLHLNALPSAIEAVKAGRSVYFSSLADIVATLAKAERDGALRDELGIHATTAAASRCSSSTRSATSPSRAGGGNLFFHSSTPATKRSAMIFLTSNRGFAEWGRHLRRFRRRDPPRSSTGSFPPRRRRPDRGVELSAARARRPVARDGPLQAARHRQSHSADPETPWPTAKKRRSRSPTRLIAKTRQTGEFCGATFEENRGAIDRRSSASGILPIWTNRRSPSGALSPLRCRRELIPIPPDQGLCQASAQSSGTDSKLIL